MKCLLIDDDIPTVKVLCDYINWNAFGVHAVLTAHNITEAKSILKASNPHIIICDIEMPKGSGIDFIKWVRENEYDSAFIFLTCHENFEFASTAISYDADAYLIKPFDKIMVESALNKAVNSLVKKNKLNEYSQYGENWLKNKDLVEQSFWRELCFARISPRIDHIRGEIAKRKLSLDVEAKYFLILFSIVASEVHDDWNESIFTYAVSNLATEVMMGEISHNQTLKYKQDGRYYFVTILKADLPLDDIKKNSHKLIHHCLKYFRCTATCYISELMTMDKMSDARSQMEELDRKNLIFRGRVRLFKDQLAHVPNIQYSLDAKLYEQWFNAGEKLQIAKKLKKELETLVAENKLNTDTLHSIQQDFLQIVYSVLYKNDIQPHILFSDEMSQALFHKSEQSILDMMKWAAHVTNETVDYLIEVTQSEGVVEKIKRFVHTNYNHNINRESLSADVFLTPDYMAKIFRQQTGLSIKDYLNHYRIGKAKEKLLQTKASISQIASECGFDSLSYFSTVFKKITGETPVAFRAKIK